MLEQEERECGAITGYDRRNSAVPAYVSSLEGWDDTLLTRPDFGCTCWEARE